MHFGKRTIPVNFHVDYWDNLGWPDPYASGEFTQRQRIYKDLGNTNVVATPGFVINGRGWEWMVLRSDATNKITSESWRTLSRNQRTIL